MSSALAISTLKPPELRSVKSDAVVKFNIAYEHYSRQLDHINSGLTSDHKTTKVRYKSCMSPELLMSLTEMREFESVTDIKDVTDTMVEKWVKSASRCSVEEQPEQVHDALSRVKFSNDPADPKGSCLEFFTGVATELRRNRAQEVITDNPKILIGLLIKKFEPAVLRTRMFRNFKYLSDDKKKYYKSFRTQTIQFATELARN